MAIAWRLEAHADDRYRFFNFSGRLAGQVAITSDDSDSQDSHPVVIIGTVDFVLGFNSVDRYLAPGAYTITWTVTGVSDPLSATFVVPLPGCGSLLLERM